MQTTVNFTFFSISAILYINAMHEYSLTQNIIETATRYAEKNSKVSKIVLVIGEASGVCSESIQMYFDIIAKGTICEGAVLEIETVKPLLKCKTCGNLFERKPFLFECACGGEGMPTETGSEFYVREIEIREQGAGSRGQ